MLKFKNFNIDIFLIGACQGEFNICSLFPNFKQFSLAEISYLLR